MRTPIIAGNWKLNKTVNETKTFVEDLSKIVHETNTEIVIAPTALCIDTAVRAAHSTRIKIAAQNMYSENNGAFTGEISPIALKEIGVEYAILGHSERRQIFHETDEMVNAKVIQALAIGIKPILCVGETKEQREAGNAAQTVIAQLQKALKNISDDVADKLIIAYEPIWAIGTGLTATNTDANDMCMQLRQELVKIYSTDFADKVRILYGGSVKSSNITALMDMSDIDGALVGGASLDATEFNKIINFK